jgi:hypothetical protein
MKPSNLLLLSGLVVSVGYVSYRAALRSAGAAGNPQTAAHSDSAREPARRSGSTDDDETRRTVQELQAEVRALREQGAAARPQPSREPRPEANETPPGPEAQAAEERKRREMLDAKQADFEAEPRNPGWASRTTATVRNEIAKQPALSAALRNVDCRTSTCRAELTDPSAAGQKAFPQLAVSLAGTLPIIVADYQTDRNGAPTVVLYMSTTETAEADPGAAPAP